MRPHLHSLCLGQEDGAEDLRASLSGTVRADTGQDVGPEESDREHHQHERDDQVHEGNQHLTDTERHAAHRHCVGRHALAGRRRRGEERGQDVLRERLEELSNNTTEVERRRQDDDVPGIKHFY